MDESTKNIDILTLQIKDNFTSGPQKNDGELKWRLLQQYQSSYLTNCISSPSLLSSYSCICSSLLDALKPSLFAVENQEQIFNCIFLNGVKKESFIILLRTLAHTNESYQQQKIINLLHLFVQSSGIEFLISDQCSLSSPSDPSYSLLSQSWDELITFIVSVPERIANKTKGQVSKIFQCNFYMAHLISSVWKVLCEQHKKIKRNEDCTVEFLGKLIGKMCMHGYAEIAVKKLASEFIKNCKDDFVWRRLSQNLLSKIPYRALESYITNMLIIIPWYGYLDWIIGDSAIKNENLHYVIAVKLVLIRFFSKVSVLHNIIGYFASSNVREPQFWELFISLLKLWSDESILKHQSLEQQKYIASALVICSEWIKEKKSISAPEGYMDKILHSIQIRIGNSDENIRVFGQVVGISLLSSLKMDAPKFEETSNTLWKEMEKVKNIPCCPKEKDEFMLEDINCFDDFLVKESIEKLKIKQAETANISNDVGSDDDLEPYATVNGNVRTNTKQPLYLSDCLQGLIEQEDADWFEQCLFHAEKLIEKSSYMVHEVAVEMSKVTLHLEDKFGTVNFASCRLNILKTLLIHCPELVSNYLTSQFYERDYNISQRLDILQVLSSASKQLSEPKLAATQLKSQYSKESLTSSVENDWKSVVDRRIAAKTRHITKVQKKPLPEMLANQFSPVAGYFFFPLMEKYDKQSKMLNLCGEDSYVLARLIFTLGTIMKSASNIPICSLMGRTLLQFLADVRNSSDIFVRQSTIYAMAMVYTSVPGYLLFADMAPDVMESQKWLHGVIENDPDTNCKVKASYALSLVLKIMKEEVPFVSEIMAS